MPPTTMQDEDLLIISDDTHIDDAPMFLDDALTASPNVDINSSLLSQDISTPATQSVGNAFLDEPVVSASPMMETTSFDFSNLTEANTISTDTISEISPIEESPVSEISTDIFDMGSLSEAPTVSEVIVPAIAITTPVLSISSTPSQESSGDLNLIISETIGKLENRQVAITSEKDGKTTQVQDLKAQIKTLEEEVSLHEAEIDTLSAESEKITKNIIQLEKMKLGDDEVINEHNAKRAVKK